MVQRLAVGSPAIKFVLHTARIKEDGCQECKRERVSTLPTPDKNCEEEENSTVFTVSQGWEDKYWHSGHLRQAGPEGQDPQRKESKEKSI